MYRRKLAPRRRTQLGYLGIGVRRVLGGAQASNPSPSFVLPLTTSLLPITAFGSATPSYTRATTATHTDWENVMRTVLSGEARFQGARRIRNLLTFTEAFSNAAWTANQSGDGVLTNNVATATSTCPAAGRAFYSQQFNAAAAVGDVYRVRVEVLSIVGSCPLSQLIGTSGTATVTNDLGGGNVAGPGVYSCLLTVTVAGSVTLRIGAGVSANVAATLTLQKPQVEAVLGQSNQNPGEYVSVGVLASPFQGAGVDGVQYFATQNGNTVAANVVTAGTGAAIPAATMLGFLNEQQSTNLCLQSENFGTTWGAVGTPARTAANAQLGNVVLDQLRDPDAGTLDGYSQVVTFTGNAVKAISFLFMQDTSTSSAIRVRDTTASADRLLAVITWTGGVPTVTMTTGTLLAVDALGLDAKGSGKTVYRARMLTTAATAANTNQIEVYPATTAALAVANTGNLNVGGMQAEDNANLCTSYIPTTTTAVTRNKDSLIYPFASNANAANGTMYAEVMTAGLGAFRAFVMFSDASGGEVQILNSAVAGTSAEMRDGTNILTAAGLSDVSTGVRKCVSRWDATALQMAVFRDGTGKTTQTFDGAMDNTAIGVGCSAATGALNLNGTIKNVKLYTVPLTDAQIAAL